MDFEIFQETFYHAQHSSQREIVSDDLRWLLHQVHPIVSDTGPKEQVGETINVVSDDIVSPLQSTLVTTNEHPIPQEVSSEQVHTISNNPINIVNVSVPNKYELPPRSTWGVLPKRYDPEFEEQRSRYSISRKSNEGLCQTTMAFNTSLYSNDVPKNVKEALRDPKWMKAMKEEISILDRNETYVKC